MCLEATDIISGTKFMRILGMFSLEKGKPQCIGNARLEGFFQTALSTERGTSCARKVSAAELCS